LREVIQKIFWSFSGGNSIESGAASVQSLSAAKDQNMSIKIILPPFSNSQLLLPTKRLGAVCRQCLLNHDDGFDRCALHIDAVLEDPTGHFAWHDASCFALEATRLGFDAALGEREDHYHVAAALNYIGNAWMAAIEGCSVHAASFLRSGLNHLDAGGLALDRPEMIRLPTDGDCGAVQSNVIQFPRSLLKVTRKNAAQFRAELQTATQEVADACKRCCCAREDGFQASAKLFRRLLANRRAAKADPTAMDMEIVQAGFGALLNGRHAHWHLAVAVRYTGYAWADNRWLNADTLDAAFENLDVAKDHLQRANHGLAMKKECETG
jgi:hypothetical protein